MRTISSAALVLCAVAAAAPTAAFAQFPGAAGLGNPTNHRVSGSPACDAHLYNTVPGCCQCQPSCCDNAWAGYCEEQVRRRAFWQGVADRFNSQRSWRPAVQCGPAPPVCQPEDDIVAAEAVDVTVRRLPPAPGSPVMQRLPAAPSGRRVRPLPIAPAEPAMPPADPPVPAPWREKAA